MLDLSQSGMDKYDAAARLYYENMISSSKAGIRYCEHAKFIKERALVSNENEQIGWEIQHSFRVKDNYGQSQLFDYTFLADSDFKSILSILDNNDPKNKEAILTINTILNDEYTPEYYDDLIKNLKETINTYQSLKSQL